MLPFVIAAPRLVLSRSRLRPATRLAALGLLCAAPMQRARAQSEAVTAVPRRPTYDTTWFGSQEGLPGTFITAIAQAQDGRLWVVASGTIARFAGDRFLAFDLPVHPNPTTFPMAPSPVRSIASGGGDSMWVTLESGVTTLRSAGLWRDQFTAPLPIARMVLPPNSAPIWHGGALTAVVGRGSDWSWAAQARTGWSAEMGVLLDLEANGTPWIADATSRFAFPFRLPANGSNGSAAAENADLLAPQLREASDRRLPLARGRFVIAPLDRSPLGVREFRGELEVVDPQGYVAARIPSSPDAIPLLLTRDGRLLVRRTDHLEVHSPTAPLKRIPIPARVQLTSLFEDREGALWIGTVAHGLLRLRRQIATTIPLPVGSSMLSQARAIVRGSGGAPLAIGQRQLFRIRGEALVSVPVPASNVIFSALETDDSTLFVGYVDSLGRDYVHMERAGRVLGRHAVSGGVRRILLDEPRDRIVWLQSQRYCVVPRATPTDRPQCTSLAFAGARDMLIARDGRYWFAGARGVFMHGPTDTIAYTPERGYNLTNARALHEDADGVLWIGTYTHGLARLRGDTLRSLGRADGLIENAVSTILEDDDGILWMGGNSAVHGVHRRAASALMDGQAVRPVGQRYDGTDGLGNPEGSGWSGLRDGDGQLWFPTFGGAVMLPARRPAWTSARPGRLTVSAITAGTRPLRVADTVQVPIGRRDLALEVAAVSLRRVSPEAIEYRLEGHGNAWQPATSVRAIVLSRLRPGRWRLEIRTPDEFSASEATRTAADTARPDTLQLVLDVPHRWYELWWLQLLIGVVIVTVVASLISVARTRRVAARAAELAAVVDEQTYWLRIERDRTAEALERAAEVGVALRRSLERHSALGHHLYQFASGAAQPALELVLTELAAFLRTCCTPLQERAATRGVRLRLTTDGADGDALAQLDVGAFARVVTLLVTEAMDHAAADTDVLVSLAPGSVMRSGHDREAAGVSAPAPSHWRIAVTHTSAGPQTEDPLLDALEDTNTERLSLAFCQVLVILHDGTLTVEAEPDRGTTIGVTLPSAGPSRQRLRASVAEQPLPTRAPAATASGVSVLIVSENDTLRDELARRLGGQYDIIRAEDGLHAMQRIRSVLPDVVIADALTPGLDGVALYRLLRADPRTRLVPVIRLTDAAEDESCADACLRKPVDDAQLFAALDARLLARDAIRARFPGLIPEWAAHLLRRSTPPLEASDELFLDHLYSVARAQLDNADFDVAQMAQQLSISRSSLYRHVRELLTASPMDVAGEVRMEHAARLLRTTALPIGVIAARVGFRNASHFARRFSVFFGVTPTTYRQDAGSLLSEDAPA